MDLECKNEFDVMDRIKKFEIEFISTRFTDILGSWHQMTLVVDEIENIFEHGVAFDGSSIIGWRSIDKSDMLMRVDPSTAFLDPFSSAPTLVMFADIYEPESEVPYSRCPRSISKKAITYLKSTGIADTSYFGPEPEFFIFDTVTVKNEPGHSCYEIEASELPRMSETLKNGVNLGHRPNLKGGYFPVSPIDHTVKLRNEITKNLQLMGIDVERHHHEVSPAQHEIGIKYRDLVGSADAVQIFKYVARNVANNFNKTATFMPKPIYLDNGSGMHCHQSLWKDDNPLFAGDCYENLSETALYYIGGIIKHARAINAFTNPSTNSYKRLIPGFEAPVILAYSAKNRSAAIRIPYVDNDKARRIETRFPDPTTCSYLGFSALLLAGIDGIKNKIHPGEAADGDLYELSKEELSKYSSVAPSLYVALEELNKDREFLTSTNVFTDDFIDSYIRVKTTEETLYRSGPHPIEFEMYYSR